MAAVHIHQMPFFSAPHLYTMSWGSWEGIGAEMTWIMNYHYLKAINREPFLLCFKTWTKKCNVRAWNQKYMYSINSSVNKCIHIWLYMLLRVWTILRWDHMGWLWEASSSLYQQKQMWNSWYNKKKSLIYWQLWETPAVSDMKECKSPEAMGFPCKISRGSCCEQYTCR